MRTNWRCYFEFWHGGFAIASDAPIAVELSPATTTCERLAVLRQWGITRVSLGVQSFEEAETRALGRAQSPAEARRALQKLREADFPVLNLDLIYGMDGQTAASWRKSLLAALEFSPEEIYLYPLYVRPLTGLGTRGNLPSDERLRRYREGRDLLLARGYRQISMRLFRAPHYVATGGLEYCCQEDGLVGIGAGARSYTAALHYSSEWAVSRTSVRAILDDYILRSAERFSVADYGCTLDAIEQRCRYLIKSLLRADGLDVAAYVRRFGSVACDEFPELTELSELGAAEWNGDILRLTLQGFEWSDVIGPWLFSGQTAARMEAFAVA